MSGDASSDGEIFCDLSMSDSFRIAAFNRMMQIDPEYAIANGIIVTANDGERVDFIRLVATALRDKARPLTEFELRNMREEAFSAYCDDCY
jgi:hypothetical protein